MNATFFLLPLAAVLMLMMPLVPIYKGVTTGQKAKHAVIFNLCAFFGVAALMIILPMGGFVTLGYTGDAPEAGTVSLCADSQGGVRAAGESGGRACLVVDADAAAQTVTILL